MLRVQHVGSANVRFFLYINIPSTHFFTSYTFLLKMQNYKLQGSISHLH